MKQRNDICVFFDRCVFVLILIVFAKREAFEETGVEHEIECLAVIHENFFNENTGSLKGMDCHETALYFTMKPRGTRELNSNSYTMGIRETMHWIHIQDLDKFKAFPSFMQAYLQSEHSGIEHIMTDARVRNALPKNS